MIVAEKKLSVQTSGINSRSFGIAMNRKMFRILSADLYSDKVKAVIRELATNAADSHVAAGKKDVPFSVHLPNRMEPYFEVKDFGTGLDNDRMFSVYTQYGVSDKTNSNEQTGCLGLGSKSPFAYTDSFTVESRFNGVIRAYTAYLNEDGFPTLSDPMTEEPTNEPNGLTVRFPVNTGDFYAFAEKAKDVFKWFKVRPTVTGAVDFAYPEEKKYIRKTDFYALPKERAGTSYAVMGNVAYPINTYAVMGYSSDKAKALLEWGVELNVNIGDLDITASREALSYDGEDGGKRTVPALKALAQKAVADLEVEVTKDITAKPTLWQARRALNDVRNSFHNFNFSAVWGGKTITDFVKVDSAKAKVEVLRKKSYDYDRNVKITKSSADQIYADGRVVFLNDGRGGYSAVRRYLAGKPSGTQVYLINEGADAAWLAETGLDEVVVKTSTLPKPERAKGERGKGVKAKVVEFKPHVRKGNNAADYWQESEIDEEDDGDFVYVEILYFSYRLKESDETRDPYDLKDIVSLLEQVTGNPLRLYGVRPADKSYLEKTDGNWIPLSEYMEKVRDEAKIKYHDLALAAQKYHSLSQVREWEAFKDEQFDANSVFGTFVKDVVAAHEATGVEGINEYVRLSRLTGVDVRSSDDSLSDAEQKVLDKYPMLDLMEGYRIRSNTDKVAEYVRMIDKQ